MALVPHLKLLLRDCLALPARGSDGVAFVGADPPRLVTHVRVMGVVVAAAAAGSFTIDDGTGLLTVELPQGAPPPVGTLVDVPGELLPSRAVRAESVLPLEDPNWESLRALECVDLFRTCYAKGGPRGRSPPPPPPVAQGPVPGEPLSGGSSSAGDKRKRPAADPDPAPVAVADTVLLAVEADEAAQLLAGRVPWLVRARVPPWSTLAAGARMRVAGHAGELLVTAAEAHADAEAAERAAGVAAAAVRAHVPAAVEAERGLVALRVQSLEPAALGAPVLAHIQAQPAPVAAAAVAAAFPLVPAWAMEAALGKLREEVQVYEVKGGGLACL